MDITLKILSNYLTAPLTHAPQPMPSLSHPILQAVLEGHTQLSLQLWKTFLQVRAPGTSSSTGIFHLLHTETPVLSKAECVNILPKTWYKPTVNQYSVSSVYILFMTQTKDQKRAKFAPTTHPNPLQMTPHCHHKRAELSSPSHKYHTLRKDVIKHPQPGITRMHARQYC